ncbi:MAG: 4,5-DOPA dioxygenase extradiol [Ignavibacteriaceae bacterium]|nr:4,5-DOPA dioxygenase extradiol [Ignavibacteriaceae bacterium]
MKRKDFLLSIAGAGIMAGLGSLRTFAEDLKERDKKMPVYFFGHGSPMNGIEDNEFSRGWREVGKSLDYPSAVLCISAHWLTHGTHVTAMNKPRTIHDFGGFPKALYEIQYPAPGYPELAEEVGKTITSVKVGMDHEWGLDHGCWVVVKEMFPDANIPVLQLSIDYNKPAEYHYKLAKELASLRKKGVLIMGSGNMVHNLRMIGWDMADSGFDWAEEMNQVFKKKIASREHSSLINYDSLNPAARLAIPTPDHYYPLLYSLGLQEEKEETEFFNDKAVMGSVTMTSVKIS